MKLLKYTTVSVLSLFALSAWAGVYTQEIDSAFANAKSEENGAKKYTARLAIFDKGAELSAPGAPTKEKSAFAKDLCDALVKSKVKEDQMYLIYMLQFVSGAESVPTLQKFLGDKDKDIADAARMALEKSEAKNASEILIKAISPRGDAKLQAGLVNSISARKDSPNVIEGAKKQKDKLMVGATWIGARDWPEDDFAAFYTEWSAGPSKALVSKGLEAKSDQKCAAFVAPFAFAKQIDLSGVFRSRFGQIDDFYKAWALNNLAGQPAAKAFIIEKGTKDDADDYTKIAAINALSTIPEVDSAKAILKIMNSTNDGKIRFYGEYGIASMQGDKKAVDAIDNLLITEAKAGNQDAFRAIGKRGTLKAIPMLLELANQGKENGMVLEALGYLADDDTFVKYTETAIKKKNDEQIKGIVRIANELNKRAKDHDAVIDKITKLAAKADDNAKSAIERACEVLSTKGVVKKR